MDRQRAKILAWACILIAVNQLGFGAIVPIVPLYAETYGVTNFAVGVTIAVYGLARFVANVPAGRLADVHGRRVTLAVGGVVTVVGNLLTAVAPNYDLFLGARFVSGFGAAMVLMGGTLVVNDIASVWNRGRMMSIYQGVFVFAVGLGPIPGGLMGEHFGLQIPFVAYAALAAGVTAIAWFVMPETRGYRDGKAARPSGSTDAHGETPAPASTAIAWTPFVLISAVSFMSFFARTGAVFNVIPLLAEDRMGLTPDRIGLGLGMLSLMGVILAYPSGWLTDRYGRKFVIVPSTILSGSSLLLFAAADDFTGYLFAAFVWGAAGGIASSSPGAYAADLAPPGRSAWLLSRHRTISDAGYVIGPLLLGGLATLASPSIALWTCAVLVALSGIAFWQRAPETLRLRSAAASASD
ncbi:MAG TPA: MFS transporter [Thermomicrobiales bacterium]|jgi:MFS family permease|nr:MFS transporter [Thermomicrobiales bacterium]